jgi:hypothetical protein
MRPTNFCHLHDTAYTRTSCVPGSLRGFHRVDTPRSLGLRAIDQGTECFTALANASADRSWTHAALPLESLASRDAGALERGFCLPTAPIAIEPLTPLSPLPVSIHTNRRCAFALPSSLMLLRAFRFSRGGKPPRSP